jgi:flagellar protein FliO/FliZ
MAYLTTKWIAKRQNSFSSGRIIKVLERVMLSKDVFLSVVKVDKKIYLISVSSGKTEMLAELPEEIADKYKIENKSADFMSVLKSFIDNKNKGGILKGWNKKD